MTERLSLSLSFTLVLTTVPIKLKFKVDFQMLSFYLYQCKTVKPSLSIHYTKILISLDTKSLILFEYINISRSKLPF